MPPRFSSRPEGGSARWSVWWFHPEHLSRCRKAVRAGGTSGNRASHCLQEAGAQVESGGVKRQDFIPGGMISVHTRTIQQSGKKKKIIVATCWSRLPLHLVRFAGLTAGVLIRAGPAHLLRFHRAVFMASLNLGSNSLMERHS